LKPARTLLPVLMGASLVALHSDEPDRARVAQGPRPLLRPVADFQNSADHTPLTSFNTGSPPVHVHRRYRRSAMAEARRPRALVGVSTRSNAVVMALNHSAHVLASARDSLDQLPVAVCEDRMLVQAEPALRQVVVTWRKKPK